MTRDNKDLLVGLDIGTSKVVAIVAELHADGEIEVIGTGQHESNGLKKGVVVDIEKTVASIQAALEEAEITSGNKIQQVVTGIAGSHIRSFNSIGMVAIKDKEVTEADVARVIETAKAVAIPTDQQILHVLPQEFIIDGQEDIREPVGMSGVRLDVKVHVVTGAVSAVQNIIKCVRRCGLAVQDLILQPLASANAVLTVDEKELGVALVDIGGGSTEIIAYAAHEMQGRWSLSLGSLAMSRVHVVGLLPTPAECAAIRAAVGAVLEDASDVRALRARHMVGMGGVLSSASRMHRILYPEDKVRLLRTSHLPAMIGRYGTGQPLSEQSTAVLLRCAPDRLHTIVPGMIIASVLAETFAAEDIQYSDSGVREGYIWKEIIGIAHA